MRFTVPNYPPKTFLAPWAFSRHLAEQQLWSGLRGAKGFAAAEADEIELTS